MNNKPLSILSVLLFALFYRVTAQTQYLNFDGSDDYIQIENNAIHDFSGDFTIEMKFKRQRLGVREDLLDKKDLNSSGSNSTNDIAFFFTSDDKINLLVRETGANELLLSSPFPIDTLNWYHIACVRSSSEVGFYINGEIVASGISNNDITSTGPLRIGSNRVEGWDPNGMVNFPFDGDIDEVRFWNIERSSLEIINNQDSEMVGTESGLISYYNFNQGLSCLDNHSVDTLFDELNIINGMLIDFDLSDATSSPCQSNWNGTSSVSVVEFNVDDVSVFPNPVKNTLSINLDNIEQFNEIKLYDVTGDLLKTLNRNELTVNNQIDFSNYANGCYFVIISDVNFIPFSYKVMKY